jgi:riboflavin biosynthesis pyrimidine reductase
VRQIFPQDCSRPDIGPIPGDSREAQPEVVAVLAALYAYPDSTGRATPWLRANMVSSVDGAATVNERSAQLSGPGDRLVFAILRSLADVILVGAGTARAEKYQPVREQEVWKTLREGRARTPPIAVVTRKLDLDLDGPLVAGGTGRARTILLTTDVAPAGRRAAAAAHADVVVAGHDAVSPAAAVAALADRGYRRVLVEGGPTLLRQIADDDLLDELCMTFSPVLEGGQAGRILAPPDSAGPGRGHTAGTAAWPRDDVRPRDAAGTAAWRGAAARLALALVLEDSGSLLCRYLRHPA